MKMQVMASLALAVCAPVLAGAADKENGAPGRGGVPEALERIEQQTSSTLQKVSDPIGGLLALRGGIQQVGKDVGMAVEATGAQVLSAVADTHTAVTEVQATIERLRAPANTVWVSPFWMDEETGEEGGFPTPPDILYPAQIVVLNTSGQTAHVGCTFLGTGGDLLVDRGKSMVISPGGSKSCDSFPPGGGQAGRGSVIVNSDHPVLVYGWYMNELQVNTHQVQREAMQFFSVDCDSPAGLEAVCALVPGAQ
jgi:hypothetical protein